MSDILKICPPVDISDSCWEVIGDSSSSSSSIQVKDSGGGSGVVATVTATGSLTFGSKVARTTANKMIIVASVLSST